MYRKALIFYAAFVLFLVAMYNQTFGQHYTDWSGFEFEQVDQAGYSVYTQFYEITKDYTISLTDYFLDGSKLPEGTADQASFYENWTRILPSIDWDFLSIEFGGILTIKKGYRWDGPSYPCFLGIEVTTHHVRSSLVHDALYDLMRMGYLESDTWDAGDNLGDATGVDNAGDHNRRMADMLIYMIGVEDGQTVGDGSLLAFGEALTDYKILRMVGRGATHDDEKLTAWKYHSAKLTAYASDGQVELSWNRPDVSIKDPNFWAHFNPFKGYTIIRNGDPLMTIAMNNTWPVLPIFPTSWVDNTVVNDSTYTYQVIPAGGNTNQYDWTNIDVVRPVGLSGTALVLDGVDDYVEANTTANDLAFSLPLNPLPVDFTMEAWVYPEAQTGTAAIMAFNTISGGNENMLFYDGDSLRFYYYDPDVPRVESVTPTPPNEWYHVAVTVDIMGQAVLYVDGTQQATFTASVIRPARGSRFSIGQEWDNETTTNHFKGRVDEVRIWNDVRTEGEIQGAMNTPLRGDEARLVGLWHFDDPNDYFVPAAPPFPDTTRKAYDATVNANDGVLHGYVPEDIPFVPSGAMGQVVSVDDYGDQTGEEINAFPKSFEMYQNYPNPFNPSTVIKFDLPERAQVTITIFNPVGQKVVELVDGAYPAGNHQVMWDGRDNDGNPVSSGLYFYSIKAGDFSEAKKMILMK